MCYFHGYFVEEQDERCSLSSYTIDLDELEHCDCDVPKTKQSSLVYKITEGGQLLPGGET